MIPFFRRIRKQLADDNKPLKYMRYAIGEIVLVVIGILIALQINNWNENRKLGKVELKMLYELLAVLETDMSFQHGQIVRLNNTFSSSKLIAKYLNDKLPYHDSLDFHFGLVVNDESALTRDQAYQKVKSYGLDFIKNDSLKEELSWTYETNSNNLDRLIVEFNLYSNVSVVPILNDLFVSSGYNTENYSVILTPLDYPSLIENKKYINALNNVYWKRQEILFFLKRRYQRMENLVRYLNEEIESRMP